MVKSKLTISNLRGTIVNINVKEVLKRNTLEILEVNQVQIDFENTRLDNKKHYRQI